MSGLLRRQAHCGTGDITASFGGCNSERGQFVPDGRRRGGRRHPQGRRPRDPRGVPEHPDGSDIPMGCRQERPWRPRRADFVRKYVIHTVGPVWHGGTRGKKRSWQAATGKASSLPRGSGLQSIAFPAISTGVYGYPREKAAKVVWRPSRVTSLVPPAPGGDTGVLLAMTTRSIPPGGGTADDDP